MYGWVWRWKAEERSGEALARRSASWNAITRLLDLTRFYLETVESEVHRVVRGMRSKKYST